MGKHAVKLGCWSIRPTTAANNLPWDVASKTCILSTRKIKSFFDATSPAVAFNSLRMHGRRRWELLVYGEGANGENYKVGFV